MPKRNIIILGPPNAGKTTLFNQLTGKNVKAVNYPGSTIELNIGSYNKNNDFSIIDTPGLYSLNPKSDDENITINTLKSIRKITGATSDKPDLIISVIDINQASRHLIHAMQVIKQGYPVIVILNKNQDSASLINEKQLEVQLGSSVLSLNVLEEKSLDSLHLLLKSYEFISYEVNELHQNPLSHQFDTVEAILNKSDYQQPTIPKFDLDRYFLHPFLGPLLFIGIMIGLFYSIFILATPFMDSIDTMIIFINEALKNILPSSLLTQLLTDGIVNGIGAVIIFVPQIALLFFGIGLLESTGYLARGAVIIDKPLSLIGLNGRCFVPILSGYACAIPAMLATRNIQQEKIKKICCFIIPLMQCSARLPVYGLLLALLFGQNAFKSSLCLTAIYLVSLLLAAGAAILAAPFIKGQTSHQFSIELPQWRKPNFSNIWLQVSRQTASFIKGAGPMILMIAIFLWAISIFPSENHSFAMMIGKWIEPLFIPMGIDWRVGVAILLSFAAREVFVSALVIMFSLASTEVQMATILGNATFLGTDKLIFTPASIIGLIFFFMVAMQCGATLAIARKEMKSTRFAVSQLVIYISVAYIGSTLIYQVLSRIL